MQCCSVVVEFKHFGFGAMPNPCVTLKLFLQYKGLDQHLHVYVAISSEHVTVM